MMDPQIGRAGFRIAFFMTFVSAMLLLVIEPGTAEFGVAILTVLIGLTFMGVVAFLARRSSR